MKNGFKFLAGLWVVLTVCVVAASPLAPWNDPPKPAAKAPCGPCRKCGPRCDCPSCPCPPGR